MCTVKYWSEFGISDTKQLLPAGNRCRLKHQPGPPTGKYTAAGQSTVDTERKDKIELVQVNACLSSNMMKGQLYSNKRFLSFCN